jgi:ATP-dependent RNA helicase DDX10/DBP4
MLNATPQVDWVVQADCPEDVDTYIHRVGRTARNDATGKSLLLLANQETKMIELLQVR